MSMTKTQTILKLFTFFAITGLLLSNVAFADVISPKKQLRSQISIEDVICDERYVKVIKVSTGNPSCVKPSTAEKLISQGWAKPVDPKLIDEVEMEKFPIGKINKLSVVEVKGSVGHLTPKLPIIGYDFVFEVCAFEQKIFVPEIFVKSDSDAQHIELAIDVDANTCQITSTTVKAANPDSITATLENKGEISAKISLLESKIADLGQKLDAEKKVLGQLVKSEDSSSDYKTKVSDSNKKIIQLRQEFNDARADYSRFLFVLSANPSKGSAPSKFTFSGTPIEGAKATILKVTQQVTGEGYNVVFEACASMKAVRAPLITVKSDIDSTNVVLANKISPNSCQLGTGQIKASDVNLIQIIFDNTEEFSAKITDLENQITQWQADLASAKRSLAELVKTAQKPADYEEEVNNLTSTIIDLRNHINLVKAALQGSLLDFYE